MFYKEVIVWKRLRHPNIVPFLGVPTNIPPFEIVCDWMDNHRITDYVRKYPGVDRVDLASGFVPQPPSRPNVFMSNFTAVGCGGRPLLPPLVQCDTW